MKITGNVVKLVYTNWICEGWSVLKKNTFVSLCIETNKTLLKDIVYKRNRTLHVAIQYGYCISKIWKHKIKVMHKHWLLTLINTLIDNTHEETSSVLPSPLTHYNCSDKSNTPQDYNKMEFYVLI